MFDSQFALSRRAVIGGIAFSLTGFAAAAQPTTDRATKIRAWVARVLASDKIWPMADGRYLNFPGDTVDRKLVAAEHGGHRYVLAVVIPEQADGIILQGGVADSKVINLHRTGLRLRRISSARTINGHPSVWDGPDCERDFEAQLAYWVNTPVSL
jgi:hypothetical protein